MPGATARSPVFVHTTPKVSSPSCDRHPSGRRYHAHGAAPTAGTAVGTVVPSQVDLVRGVRGLNARDECAALLEGQDATVAEVRDTRRPLIDERTVLIAARNPLATVLL